jgi:hypothetical protein
MNRNICSKKWHKEIKGGNVRGKELKRRITIPSQTSMFVHGIDYTIKKYIKGVNPISDIRLREPARLPGFRVFRVLTLTLNP